MQACVDLLRRFGATDIYLFGSRASGRHRQGSDYDFAVRGVQEADYYRVVGELLLASSVPVDVVLLDADSSFSRHIEEKIATGRVVHVG